MDALERVWLRETPRRDGAIPPVRRAARATAGRASRRASDGQQQQWFEDNSLREAADHMVREEIGRLPVVSRAAPRRPIGMLTRSDLLAAHRRRLDEALVAEQSLRWWPPD